jgi:hypothetical protein
MDLDAQRGHDLRHVGHFFPIPIPLIVAEFAPLRDARALPMRGAEAALDEAALDGVAAVFERGELLDLSAGQ